MTKQDTITLIQKMISLNQREDTITLIQKMISLNQREHTITLIKKMILLNQREQAARTYKMANETWPEWELKAAFEAMKAKQ